MYTVYSLQTSDGKIYVGVTSDSVSRRWNHGNGYRFKPELWAVIQSEGWESVKKTVHAINLDEKSASEMEQSLIERFHATNSNYGYNSELGGVGKSKRLSTEIKRKIGDSQIGALNHNFGTHFSEEHRRKISDSNRGQQRSDETKRRIGRAHEIPVNQYTREGVLVRRWDSGKEAAIATDTQPGHIAKVCKGERATAGGYKWAYAK